QCTLPIVMNIGGIDDLHIAHIVSLMRHWSSAVTGRIGAGHVVNIDPINPGFARNGSHVEKASVRTRNVRKGTIVLVEHKPLRTLEENIANQFAIAAQPNKGFEVFAVFKEPFQNSVALDDGCLPLCETVRPQCTHALFHPLGTNPYEDVLDARIA